MPRPSKLTEFSFFHMFQLRARKGRDGRDGTGKRTRAGVRGGDGGDDPGGRRCRVERASVPARRVACSDSHGVLQAAAGGPGVVRLVLLHVRVVPVAALHEQVQRGLVDVPLPPGAAQCRLEGVVVQQRGLVQ